MAKPVRRRCACHFARWRVQNLGDWVPQSKLDRWHRIARFSQSLLQFGDAQFSGQEFRHTRFLNQTSPANRRQSPDHSQRGVWSAPVRPPASPPDADAISAMPSDSGIRPKECTAIHSVLLRCQAHSISAPGTISTEEKTSLEHVFRKTSQQTVFILFLKPFTAFVAQPPAVGRLFFHSAPESHTPT